MEIISRTEKIKDGETIVKEGAWSFYAYILKFGKAKVMKNIDGKPVLLGTVNEGDIFGEVAFFGEEKRTASVIADGDVEVDMIPRDSFMEALDQLPEDVRSKLNALVSDLISMTEVRGRLIALRSELLNMRAKMIDPGSFQKELEKMPELLRRVVIAFVLRLNASIDGCTKLAGQAEEAFKAIDALSLPLAK